MVIDNGRMSDGVQQVFWSRTKRLTAWLLAIWLLINLAVPWFARDLDKLHGFGFPLGYWLAAEGALLMYLVIIVIYVRFMDRLDAGYLEVTAERRDEQQGTAPP